MANEPKPKSYEQIFGDMFGTYMSKIGVNDVNTGSAVTSFFEAVAQAIYRASGDTFSILRDRSVDRASPEALKRIARDERVFPFSARISTGTITVTDTNFSKIATRIYAGANPPNIGSTEIRVSDTSSFPATGSIYIGRGTANVEGPLPYTSITNVGSFSIINLSSPTTKFHNLSESVILAQGGVRNISTGTVVKTLASGSSPDINFTTTKTAILLDGEDTISNIPVAAQEPGLDGNIPRGAIREFVGEPFSGASVTNPNPFTTGRNAESDPEIKIRVKKERISKGLGTATAVKTKTLGATSESENSVITSNEIFSDGDLTKLLVDNGEGLEEKTEGVGLEFIVDSALGGEQRFQLSTGGSQSSIAKATLETSETAPFNISPNNRLSILVGDVLSEHVFNEGDFRSNGFATAFEIASSVNSNANLLFSARTLDNGTRVAFEAKAESNEFLLKTTPTSGVDAGDILGLSSNEIQTLRLYKNNVLLNRNGRSALLESENQIDWSNTISDGDTLIVSVDGTTPITYTFNNSDFLAEGSHTTVSKNNSVQSWVNVINDKIVGLTASINGNRIVLTSNLGASSRAKITIDSLSDLVAKGMFTEARGLSDIGREFDYTLSVNTAQIKLTKPLAAGDSLTAGNELTEGTVSSDLIVNGEVTLASDASIWWIVDNSDAQIINHGVANGVVVDFTKEASNIVRFKASAVDAFANIQSGDYVVLWSNQITNQNRIEGRVLRIGTDTLSNDFFEVRLTASEYASTIPQSSVNFIEGLAFIRSDSPPQKIKIAAGTYFISTIASNLTNQIIGASAITENDEFIKVSTDNKSTGGSILLFTRDDAAKPLLFEEGSFSQSITSQFGLAQSNNSAENTLPLFIHSSIASDRDADTPDALIADFESDANLSTLNVDPNVMVCMQHPYQSAGISSEDAQPADECVQIDDITGGTTVDIDSSQTIRRLRIGDRYYLVNPLDFDYNDNLVVVLDNDSTGKTFPINLYRRAIANTTQSINPSQFRAYDIESGATTEFEEFFTSSYSFKNYKALMKARSVLDPQSMADEDAILYRSSIWGKSGEFVDIGYQYPIEDSQSITSTVTVSDKVRVRIRLKSGSPVSNDIDGTTQWNVTITPNTPVAGVDEVTYTHDGTGTAPAMTTLAAGDYVTINSLTNFDSGNLGIFRVVSATSSSFTVRRPNGVAVVESNIPTISPNGILLYEDNNTTAQEIVNYVNNNLSEWIEAEIVDDNGSTGAGIINESTYEDSDFTVEATNLLDGLNWVKSSSLGAVAPNAQFVFKRDLSLPSFNTNTVGAYAFNNGEEVRLVPTTIEQVESLLSVLAVTGFTTLGDIDAALREKVLQLNTQVLGSSGSVKVAGGSANSVSASIIGNVSKVSGFELVKASISSFSSNGLNSGSWVKISSSQTQKKNTGISFTTNVTTTPNSPSANKSKITLGNRDVYDRYFGQPRNHFRDRARVFQLERQGSLVNISWDNNGNSPAFTKIVEFNDAAGGNMSVSFDSATLTTNYIADAGTRLFSEVQVGDTVVIQNFANSNNNGTFTVNGVSDDATTLNVSNPNGVNSGAVVVSPGDIIISTEIVEGDTVEISEPFNILNQGKFRVIRRFDNSIYIENNVAVEEQVVVVDNLRAINPTGSTFDVTVPGNMRLTKTAGAADFTSVKLGDILTIGTDFNLNNQGDFMVVDVDPSGNWVEVANALAVVESGIVVADVLESQAPALLFSPYDNTRAGDVFQITGGVLDEDNIGVFTVSEVLSKNTIVVDAILDPQSVVQLNNLSNQVFVVEENPYVGYKRIEFKAINPDNSSRAFLVFDTTNNFDKINQSSGSSISVESKLNLPTTIQLGIDAYKFHTGLIAEANKITYGDPRDTSTYPGVSAAGAEIFIKAPLIRKLEVSINVRVQTGIPFGIITEQVRNNIAALINSSPIGQPIAISDIISTVNRIPGVTAVSITSPTFDPQNDVIVVNPFEKPFVLDIVNDITVSKVE